MKQFLSHAARVPGGLEDLHADLGDLRVSSRTLESMMNTRRNPLNLRPIASRWRAISPRQLRPIVQLKNLGGDRFSFLAFRQTQRPLPLILPIKVIVISPVEHVRILVCRSD